MPDSLRDLERDWWTDALTEANAERDAAIGRAEKAESRAAYWQRRAEFAWNQGDKLAGDLVHAVFGDDADREEFRQEWVRIAALGDPEPECRFVAADGRETEFDLHNEGPCGCRREMRDWYATAWRPADECAKPLTNGA